MAEEQEIISRPASHPIATTLLLISMIGTGLGIFLIWQELFGEYLPTPAPGQAVSGPSSKKIAEGHIRNHYENDFKDASNAKNMLQAIEKELQIKPNNGIGGDLSSPDGTAEGGGDGGGGGEDG